MNEHPIRLILSDDLNRRRSTVFFRLLLAIPHYVWFLLWGFAAVVAAFANWFATLARGRSPLGLHNFLAAYVKYATQLYAYLSLAADPYPEFDGRPGYPVDVTIEPPARQSRWRVAARLILVLPAWLLVSALVSSWASSGYKSHSGRAVFSAYGGGFSLLQLVAVLGWFAILARGKMPRGLRDAAGYSLSYAAQFWGYLFLLTDRYPNSDPLVAIGELPVRADPIRLELEDDLRRSRLTVFFRLLLAFPHLIWLELWGILALLATIANWFVTLASGRSSAALHRFLSAYLRYLLHVYAFLYLVASPFPGFVGAPHSYPLEVLIEERRPQHRLKVLGRLMLAIPVLLLMGAYAAAAAIAAFLGWFAALATGRMPRGLRNLAALALRYHAQTVGYLLLLSDAYPYSGPCLNPPPSTGVPAPSSPDSPPAVARPAMG